MWLSLARWLSEDRALQLMTQLSHHLCLVWFVSPPSKLWAWRFRIAWIFLSISELSAPGPRGLCTPSESSGHTVSRGRIYGRFVRQLLWATSPMHRLLGGAMRNANSRQRLQSVLNKLKKHGFLPHEFPSHEELCEQMCRGLFNQVLNNKFHVLHQLLPPDKEMPYSLRPRAHNRTIPIAHNSAFKKNFMIATI